MALRLRTALPAIVGITDRYAVGAELDLAISLSVRYVRTHRNGTREVSAEIQQSAFGPGMLDLTHVSGRIADVRFQTIPDHSPGGGLAEEEHLSVFLNSPLPIELNFRHLQMPRSVVPRTVGEAIDAVGLLRVRESSQDAPYAVRARVTALYVLPTEPGLPDFGVFKEVERYEERSLDASNIDFTVVMAELAIDHSGG